MDKIERFLIDGNVSRLFDRAVNEPSAHQRALLSRMMIEQENKFARASERLGIVDDYIAKCNTWISKQYKFVETGASHSDSLKHLGVLNSLTELRSCLQAFRDLLSQQLDFDD